MTAVTYTDPARVVETARDGAAPTSGRTVSGYGGRLPTPYRVWYRGDDGRIRWYRVRVMQYGNAGTAYIVVGGRVLVLDTDTEHGLTGGVS